MDSAAPHWPGLITLDMKTLLRLLTTTLLLSTAQAVDIVVMVGAPGEEEYGKAFLAAADAWEAAAKKGEVAAKIIGREESGTLDLTALEQTLEKADVESSAPLWIVLLGHGTFDGREARFNLRGKDLRAAQLNTWLDRFKRPVAIINCSASSAPFIKKLAKAERVIMTATKSGSEDSYARFGEYLAKAINNPDADIDRDGGTSLLEAFLAASKGVEEFYEKEGRIKTEEAIVDDNGDGFGTPATWFRGVRATKKPKDDAQPDGLRAHQFHLVPSAADRDLSPAVRQERDALEARLFALRERRDKMKEEDYFRELEAIARMLATLYQEAKEAPEPKPDSVPEEPASE